MKFFSGNRTEIARYVEDQLRFFALASPWTMTITRENSEVYSVVTATDMSSAGIDEEQVAKFYSETQVNT